ncbi:MAG: hypothetical protein M3452_08190, partial [Chloroflexota bacterium]|nr:hypothetical protein [Chloroflexota bacterium]
MLLVLQPPLQLCADLAQPRWAQMLLEFRHGGVQLQRLCWQVRKLVVFGMDDSHICEKRRTKALSRMRPQKADFAAKSADRRGPVRASSLRHFLRAIKAV